MSRGAGFRSALAALACGLFFLWSGDARAALTLVEKSVSRVLTTHEGTDVFFFISQSDCEGADVFTFAVNNSAPSSQQISTWVSEGTSTDCTLPDERVAATGHCTFLGEQTAHDKTSIISLPAKEIAGALQGVKGCTDTSGGGTDPRPVTIWFMIVTDPGATPVDVVSWQKTSVDLVGPPAPTDVTAAFGENRIILSFTEPDDDDRNGYSVYCDVAGGVPAAGGAGGNATTTTSSVTAGVGGAGGGVAGSGGVAGGGAGGTGGTAGGAGAGGSGGDAGAGGAAGGSAETTAATTGAGGGDCTSSALEPGKLPVPEIQFAPFLRGSIDGRGSEIDADNLENGVNYACAIGTIDKLGNVGPLSALACETPFPVDDFFKLYRKAGGEAGGGFCSIGGVGEGRMILGVGALAALLGLVGRRTWRRRPLP